MVAAALFILLSNWLMRTDLIKAPKQSLLDSASLSRLYHFEKDLKGKVEENCCGDDLAAEAQNGKCLTLVNFHHR